MRFELTPEADSFYVLISNCTVTQWTSFTCKMNFVLDSCEFVDGSFGPENRTIHEITQTDTNQNSQRSHLISLTKTTSLLLLPRARANCFPSRDISKKKI